MFEFIYQAQPLHLSHPSVPAVVANCRGHHNQGAIFALNLLLGWTLSGWVAAFVWACTNAGPKEKPSRTGLLVTRDDYRREHIQQQRENEAKESERAKWRQLSSEPLPKVVQPTT